ncbi:hypothetical protein ABAC460_15895 [Asticcacaulis sp. AC460]|uniref:hypothetical protein n=1 Tax=Asticcacaulis sp. AC460 TaxID=1282360 RepID=UPI0003C3E450|nr:hypothetical protein [Asticcacaulis sp. AC460]ESQ88141.1 hypothetical protein ABAC460_15895 [Asticcacaulis sp. AC460]
MKIVTLTVLAAFAVASATPVLAANTSQRARASDDLNRAQLSEYNQFVETRQASYATTTPQVSYVEGDAEDTPRDIYVLAPPRDAQENSREPQQSPQSAGQPAIDTPYIAVQPTQ